MDRESKSMNQPISNRSPVVFVEYDSPTGERTRKRFTNPYEARRFYCEKLNKGLQPRVIAEK